MSPAGSRADYQLAWPRQLFRSEATALVNNTRGRDWADRCELLLEDAFTGEAPRDEFQAEEPAEQRAFLILTAVGHSRAR